VYLIVILFIWCIALFSLLFIPLFDKTEIVVTSYNFSKARKSSAIYDKRVFKIMNKNIDKLDEIYAFISLRIYLSRKSLLNPIMLLASARVLWLLNPSEVHILKFDWSRQTGTLRRGVRSVNLAWQQTSCYVIDGIMMPPPGLFTMAYNCQSANFWLPVTSKTVLLHDTEKRLILPCVSSR